jgi:hypothetical protein
MFTRCVFFYFVKNYEPELACREMTENCEDGKGTELTVNSVRIQYAYARERISRYAIYSVRNKKFGGPNQEVMVDFLKLPIKNKKGKNEEYIVLGFIEAQTGRSRCYVIPNNKQQTIV